MRHRPILSRSSHAGLLRAIGAASILSFVVSGCSNTVELTRESRHEIRNVHVRTQVPEQASISGHLAEIDSDTRGSVWFSSLITMPVGVVYEVMDWSDNKKQTSDRIQSFLAESGVDMPQVVRNKFLRHLANAKVFESVYADSSHATFELEIEHGLSDGLGWRGGWKPWITAVGSLVDRDGSVVWRYEATISEHDARVPQVEYPARQEKFLRRAYATAADLVAKELVDHLVQG
jgi:hypothetical protein